MALAHQVLDASSDLKENCWVFLGSDTSANLQLIRLLSGVSDDFAFSTSASSSSASLASEPFGLRCQFVNESVDVVQVSPANAEIAVSSLIQVWNFADFCSG